VAVADKVRKVTSFFNKMFRGKKSDYYSPPKKSAATIAKNILIDFVEKYKGVRRTILAVVLWVNIHIFFVTIEMYRKVNFVDVQWVIYAGYWTAILGTFIGFYTTTRTREFNSDTPYSKRGEWLSSKPQGNLAAGATEFTPDDLSSYSNQKFNDENLKT